MYLEIIFKKVKALMRLQKYMWMLFLKARLQNTEPAEYSLSITKMNICCLILYNILLMIQNVCL